MKTNQQRQQWLIDRIQKPQEDYRQVLIEANEQAQREIKRQLEILHGYE